MLSEKDYDKIYHKTKVISVNKFYKMSEDRQREIRGEINRHHNHMIMDLMTYGLVRKWHHYPPYYIKY